MRKIIFAATVFLLTLIALPLYSQQPPTITKVEPPDWWAGLPSPTLLLYGTGFANAHATLASAPAGITIKQQRPGKDGLYYSVELAGTENANPGLLKLHIQSAAGS